MKRLSLYLMALLYVAAGINHFVHPAFYLAIMPWWLPWPGPLVQLSGVCEILLGLLLLPAATRRFAAWMIIVMLIVFFVVHIQMLIDYSREHHPLLWVAIVRLPLQFVLIWWAWLYARPRPRSYQAGTPYTAQSA
jgi:uncharacterized membrane protein